MEISVNIEIVLKYETKHSDKAGNSQANINDLIIPTLDAKILINLNSFLKFSMVSSLFCQRTIN